jgi:hypothetical protein
MILIRRDAHRFCYVEVETVSDLPRLNTVLATKCSNASVKVLEIFASEAQARPHLSAIGRYLALGVQPKFIPPDAAKKKKSTEIKTLKQDPELMGDPEKF